MSISFDNAVQRRAAAGLPLLRKISATVANGQTNFAVAHGLTDQVGNPVTPTVILFGAPRNASTGQGSVTLGTSAPTSTNIYLANPGAGSVTLDVYLA